MKTKMQSRIINLCTILVAGALVLALEHPSATATDDKEKKPVLCQGNYLTEEAAKEQLARFAQSYSNLAEWKERAKRVREGILRGAEL